MTEDELDKLEVQYLRRFDEGPVYPPGVLDLDERARLVREALKTGEPIPLPPPPPGSLEYVELEYMRRFNEPIPHLYLPPPWSDEYRAKLEKALADDKPIDTEAIMQDLMKRHGPNVVI